MDRKHTKRFMWWKRFRFVFFFCPLELEARSAQAGVSLVVQGSLSLQSSLFINSLYNCLGFWPAGYTLRIGSICTFSVCLCSCCCSETLLLLQLFIWLWNTRVILEILKRFFNLPFLSQSLKKNDVISFLQHHERKTIARLRTVSIYLWPF